MLRVPAPIESVVFDSDGLFFDTHSHWRRAEERLFERHGQHHGEREARALLGRARIDAEPILAGYLGEDASGPELYLELETLLMEELAEGCRAMPGALALARRLKAQAIPLGLASNSPRSVVESALRSAVGASPFDVIVTAEEVANPKPAPDIYVAACTHLSATPKGSVAFEDSLTGVRSAAAAGMFVVGVPSSPGAFPPGEASVVVETLESPELPALLGLPTE